MLGDVFEKFERKIEKLKEKKQRRSTGDVELSGTPIYEEYTAADIDFTKMLRNSSCYDAMPTSSKLAVFDTRVGLKRTFFARYYTDCRTALLYDHQIQEMVGFLLVSDFIRIIVKYESIWKDKASFDNGYEHLSSIPISKLLSKFPVSTYSTGKSILTVCLVLLKNDDVYRPFLPVEANENLLGAAKKLFATTKYRLPVTDPETGNLLYVLTHCNLLKYMYSKVNYLPKNSRFCRKPTEFGIGTWGEKLVSVKGETSLFECVKILFDRKINAIPVTDKKGVLIDVIKRFDVAQLISIKRFEIYSFTVKQGLKTLNELNDQPRHFFSCDENEPIWTAVTTLLGNEVRHAHRVFIVNSAGILKGVITLSDVLKLFLQNTSDTL